MSAISRTVASVTLPEASSLALRAARAIALHGFAHVIERELVEHDDVGAGVERLVEFIERFHFHFDRDAGRSSARRGDGAADRAGGDDVVLLDEHHVVEPEAMVLRAAAARGVFLREPQAGQRLARIENAAAGAGDRFDVAAARRWRWRTASAGN